MKKDNPGPNFLKGDNK